MIRFCLQKHYQGIDIDVSVASEGPVLALFGPSGAGKSTLLKMIAGLVSPDSGSIELDDACLYDRDGGINLQSGKRQIGYVPQHGLLFPHLSVERNITYSQWAGRRDPKIKLENLTQMLGIDDLLIRSPLDLSGGERQRVALARALYSSPRLLLLDEPLSALDEGMKGEALNLLEMVIRQFEIPAIYVSHSPGEVLQIADDMAVLEKGLISGFGSPMELTGRLEGLSGLQSQVLLEGEVLTVPEGANLGKIRTRAMEFYVASDLPPRGTPVKVKIDPRDVMLSLDLPERISAQNRFAGEVMRVEPVTGTNGRMVLVHVAIGNSNDGTRETLVARITAHAVQQLMLEAGMPIHAVIKTVALLDRF